MSRDKRYLLEYDYFHQTCYHWAAKRGYQQVLSTLLDCDKKHVNFMDNEYRTPLWHAAKNNLQNICEILLNSGANPFLPNREGKRPIDVVTDNLLRSYISKRMEVKFQIFL